jgi:hypothetical protein
MKEISLTEEMAFKINALGKSFDIKKPTAREVATLHKKTKDADEFARLEALLDFFESLGLPKELSSRLNTDQVIELSENLLTPKKK